MCQDDVKEDLKTHKINKRQAVDLLTGGDLLQPCFILADS